MSDPQTTPEPESESTPPDPEVAATLGHDPDAKAVRRSNTLFYVVFAVIGGTYVLLILLMLLADGAYMTRETIKSVDARGLPWVAVFKQNPMMDALADRKIQYSIWLSLISCTMSAVISVLVAVPMGYLMSLPRKAITGCHPRHTDCASAAGRRPESAEPVSVCAVSVDRSRRGLSGPVGGTRSVFRGLRVCHAHDESDV